MTRAIIIPATLALLATPALGDLDIRWSTIDGGGATSSGGNFVIHATIGQHDGAPIMSGSAYDSAPGFWPMPEFEGCLADCTGNGILNVDDIDCFVSGFLGANLLVADCDENGVLNVDDIDCFVTAFLAGCP